MVASCTVQSYYRVEISKGTDFKDIAKIKHLHSNWFGVVVFEMQAWFFSIQLLLACAGEKKKST